MDTSILVGASRVKLEYPEGFFPHASSGGRYFIGIHDEIFVRALFIGNEKNMVLLIAVELGEVSGEWLRELSREAEIPPKNIFLTATHTNAVPYADSTWEEEVVDAVQSKAFSE